MMVRRQLSLRLARQARTRAFLPFLERVEDRVVLSTFFVTNTGDNMGVNPVPGAGTGTLRQAIIDANASTQPTSDIVFAIPASTAPGLDVPVGDKTIRGDGYFDPQSQTWTIQPLSPLPPITRPVTIDGFSQGEVPIPYVYPLGGAMETLSINGNPTGGSFTLTTSTPLPVATTTPILFDPTNSQIATANEIGAALQDIVGVGNVTVAPAGVPNSFTITFQGLFAGDAIPLLVATSNLTGGTNPSVTVTGTPVEISSTPNTVTAIDGNDAHARVIIDGSQTGGATGFVVDASHSTVRGLIIDGFGVGLSVPQVDSSGNPVVGDVIQGNFIGKYTEYPVDPNTGAALPAPDNVNLKGIANTQGVVLYANNTTLGGTNPQEDNVISGNAEQGVLIQPSATGNVVEGNQIGIVGPSTNGLYFPAGNGAEGILDYGSSNQLGGPVPAAGNLISANGSHGIHISGSVATRTIVAANIIGLGPGGGYAFGTGNPGNGDAGDGIFIENSALNQIGGPTSAWGNVISSNFGAGVSITGVTSTGNTILNNLIGVTADGNAAKGNAQQGVADYSPGTTVGPGNVISGNLLGVLISGSSATGVVVEGNLIGTDMTGTINLGNSQEGVLIDDSSGNTVTGNANGSQVISGNLAGVAITGTSSTGNLVVGNFIGSDKSGLNPLPNAQEGVSILDASGNTIGGTTSSSANLISGNHWGVRLGGSATDNLIEGNFIGTDSSHVGPLPNEVDGIIINATGNMIGGTISGAGNTVAYNIAAGVSVQSGAGNAILSNSVFSNGTLGIELVASGSPPPNNLQAAPVLSQVTSDSTSTHVVGSLKSTPNTTFLVQFFTSAGAALLPSPQGQNLFAPIPPTEIATNGSGFAAIDLVLPSPLPLNAVLTATATNLTTDDTSQFSPGTSESTAIGFATATYMVDQTSGSAVIAVSRTSDVGTSTVQFATVPGGTAVTGVDYTSASGILVFQPGQLIATFTVGIINTQEPGGVKTVNLALSNPTGGVLDFNTTAVLQITHLTGGTAGLFTVTNTNDSGPGSLRQAIIAANTTPGPNDITFAIPAAIDPELAVPVPGFDPSTQDWTITLQSPLPPITDTVSIDGYTQAEVAVPFRYPSTLSSAVQDISINGFPTGGTFTLTTAAPLPVGTTIAIPFDAAPAGVQAALEAVVGAGNVAVTGVEGLGYSVSFQNAFAHMAIPDLIPTSQLSGGTNPTVTVSTFIAGGESILPPTLIQSVPNSVQAIDGNNAMVRVIIDGTHTGGGTGFVLERAGSSLRGLAIDGFGIGVSAPQLDAAGNTNVGDLIQGNYIGRYLVYPVDPNTGTPEQAPNDVVLAGLGNALQGVYLDGSNTTVGGTNPQESNVISGNGQQGVWIDASGTGNVVEGNQIGVVGPSTNGLYFSQGNGVEGVLVEGSSNQIGGPGPNAGNVISANHLDGVRISGSANGATDNTVASNYIGIAPGGGFKFGSPPREMAVTGFASRIPD